MLVYSGPEAFMLTLILPAEYVTMFASAVVALG